MLERSGYSRKTSWGTCVVKGSVGVEGVKMCSWTDACVASIRMEVPSDCALREHRTSKMGSILEWSQRWKAGCRLYKKRGECAAEFYLWDEKRKRSAKLIMSCFVCGAYYVEKSGGRWALYRCGCRGERHRVEFIEDEVSRRAHLVLATKEDGDVRSDWLVWFCLWSAHCEQMGRR